MHLVWGVAEAEELRGGSEAQREKIRPRKSNSQAWAEPKTHANKTPKPYNSGTYDLGRSSSRVSAKIEAHFESQSSPLSNSLLELLPTHINNTSSQISTTNTSAKDAEVLYSFDNKGPSPVEKCRNVELGGLVEKAEKKWVEAQTERIVKGEYEVLDGEGETTVLTSKGKSKKSPKQKAALKNAHVVKGLDGEEDDGFELV